MPQLLAQPVGQFQPHDPRQQLQAQGLGVILVVRGGPDPLQQRLIGLPLVGQPLFPAVGGEGAGAIVFTRIEGRFAWAKRANGGGNGGQPDPLRTSIDAMRTGNRGGKGGGGGRGGNGPRGGGGGGGNADPLRTSFGRIR